MNSDFSSFVFPKLDDSNYSSWNEDMKVLLMDRGCWNFAIGEEKLYPEEATEKEKLEYEWRKQRYYTTIYQEVERKLLPLIRHTTDGKEAWNILKDNFEPVSEARLAVSSIRTRTDRMKDAEFTDLEVERQLINESGRIQLKKKDLNTTENAYNVGSSPGKEISKKSVERSGNVLDLTKNLVNTRKTVTLKNLPKKRVSLPLKVGCILPERVKENEIEETELMRQFSYRTLIGFLYFIANRSRPDIEFAVNTVTIL
ncbi:hypothetical protein HNY73_021499 [Argiope bruennichi]|uniref:DUF4219 domain-containing protein n=1 Tax=Argiope bruennichi TaxID=94029 RepID=A0A8T0DZC0_ARGBR|nr:hypothetical protein HNY73_021499 [Argiope bruennichi]